MPQAMAGAAAAVLRRRRLMPIPAKPSSIIIHVLGSGTALMVKLSVSNAFLDERRRREVRLLLSDPDMAKVIQAKNGSNSQTD